jgi:hypothetical protein
MYRRCSYSTLCPFVNDLAQAKIEIVRFGSALSNVRSPSRLDCGHTLGQVHHTPAPLHTYISNTSLPSTETCSPLVSVVLIVARLQTDAPGRRMQTEVRLLLRVRSLQGSYRE